MVEEQVVFEAEGPIQIVVVAGARVVLVEVVELAVQVAIEAMVWVEELIVVAVQVAAGEQEPLELEVQVVV